MRPHAVATLCLVALGSVARGDEPAARASSAPSATVAAAPPAAAPALVEKGPFCSPLFAAGVVLGISEESDVVALLGAGAVVPPQGDGRARAHLDPTGRVVMITETATDDLVARISIRWATSLPASVSAQLEGHASARMRDIGALGPGGSLRLGQGMDEIRRRFGTPSRIEGAPEHPTWIYSTDYAPTECVVGELVMLTFVDGAVARIDLDGGF